MMKRTGLFVTMLSLICGVQSTLAYGSYGYGSSSYSPYSSSSSSYGSSSSYSSSSSNNDYWRQQAEADQRRNEAYRRDTAERDRQYNERQRQQNEEMMARQRKIGEDFSTRMQEASDRASRDARNSSIQQSEYVPTKSDIKYVNGKVNTFCAQGVNKPERCKRYCSELVSYGEKNPLCPKPPVKAVAEKAKK